MFIALFIHVTQIFENRIWGVLDNIIGRFIMPKKLANTQKDVVEKFFIENEKIHKFTMGKTNDQKTQHRVRLIHLSELTRTQILLLAEKEIRREIAECARMSKAGTAHIVPGTNSVVKTKTFYTKSLIKNQNDLSKDLPVVDVTKIRPLTEKKQRDSQKSLSEKFEKEINQIFRSVLISKDVDIDTGNKQIETLCHEFGEDFELNKITLQIK
jgi:hypothetical protein